MIFSDYNHLFLPNDSITQNSGWRKKLTFSK
nr:MAG TPA: hypothetical protein [Caudoviricetes sp.]